MRATEIEIYSKYEMYMSRDRFDLKPILLQFKTELSLYSLFFDKEIVLLSSVEDKSPSILG
jgi:hypothetical protein